MMQGTDKHRIVARVGTSAEYARRLPKTQEQVQLRRQMLQLDSDNQLNEKKWLYSIERMI
jgi:hypothetical protein